MIFILLHIITLRTENVVQISTPESFIRLLLEKTFGIRPRFKEFLIGHPILILGLAFNLRIFIILGLVGQTSLINTFLHAHTPFYICLFRTFYGLIIGFFIGVIFLGLCKKLNNKINFILDEFR